jgi:hypothetical protein
MYVESEWSEGSGERISAAHGIVGAVSIKKKASLKL